MIDTTLRTMDSLGIKSVLIDEYWYWLRHEANSPMEHEPGYRLENGAWRADYPVAKLASNLHPDRFSFFVRLDRKDPDPEAFMRRVAASPHARAFRLLATWSLEEAEAFINGGYEPLLDVAQDLGLPVCMFIPGYVEYLPHYLKKFPKLTFVVDHCGMGLPGHPPGRSEAESLRTQSLGYFDEVLKLAEFPNLALKWCHATTMFGGGEFDAYEPARRYLRRAITAFGADRLMWASDSTMVHHYSWKDLLDTIKSDPELSQDEKEWVLGRSARRILKWPTA
jgi:predicted TIM-barrel fold metal-dependent hydrolase